MDLTDMMTDSSLVVRSDRALRTSGPRDVSETSRQRVRSGKGAKAVPGKARGGMSRRLPPHSLEAEASLLGAMLLSQDAVATAMETVTVEHFYRRAHARVFEVIHRLYGSGDPVDPITVHETLERSDPEMAAAVGGLDGLLGMQMQTPAISNAEAYSQIIRDNFLLRRLIETAGEIAEIGYSRPIDVPEAVDLAESLMYKIAHHRTEDSTLPLNKVLDSALTHLEELYSNKRDVTGTPTGYVDLDKLLAGLHPKGFYVIGARPSMGKTAFALGMAHHAAIRNKLPVLMFSLEMGGLELANRLICAEVEIDSSVLRTGNMDSTKWGRIVDSMSELGDSPFYIDDNPAVTIMDIRARARRLASRVGKLSMVVVDYLQLMTSRSRRQENRQLEVAEISRGLKILARELDCPVVAVSQLSRNLEMRQNKRPILADLRESGAIEQDADVVMFIYRDEVYNPENTDTAGTAEVIVAKNRNGPTGTVTLAFLPRFACFRTFARTG